MVIAADDVLAPMLNDIDDVERVLPGTIDVMREWLRLYKTVDGKPENKFGMEERAMGREYTMAAVEEDEDEDDDADDDEDDDEEDDDDESAEEPET